MTTLRHRRPRIAALAAGGFAALLLASACEHHARIAGESGHTVVYATVAPPPTRYEYTGSAPSPRHVWVQGYWAWRDGRYSWVAGRWAVPPHPNARWSPGRWNHYKDRYVWVAGRWI